MKPIPDLSKRYTLQLDTGVCELHGDHAADLSPWLIAPYSVCSDENADLVFHEDEWGMSSSLQEIPLRDYLKMVGVLKFPDPGIDRSIASFPDFAIELCPHISTKEDFFRIPMPHMTGEPLGLIRYRFCDKCDMEIRALVPR